MTELLRPYVPRPVIDWLRETPDATHREVRGSLVFADISGFTTLTERLAQQGKAGAEEMGDLLNATFERLLVPAYEYGATLLKWGGDAALLLFTDDEHEPRACTAAFEMQKVIRQVGNLRTSAGNVRLRMSVGVHAGSIDFFLVGAQHRELLVLGPAATAVTRMEQIADAGEVMLSRDAAAAFSNGVLGAARDAGILLAQSPQARPWPQTTRPVDAGVDLVQSLPKGLRDHLADGSVDSEHRHVATGFVQFIGTDSLLATAGAAEVAAALAQVVDAVVRATDRHEVTFLASDVAVDGGKIILTSGAPRSHDRLEERLLCALREIMDTPLPLRLRAGATSGRVFAGDFGPSYRRTYSVVGDAVNLAARLMGKAGPGQIVTTAEVAERSRTRFEVTSLEPFRVKGKSELIDAVAVGDATTRSAGSRRGHAAMVGRDAELALIRSCLDAAAAGDGRVLDIVGDAGLGKTRMLESVTAEGVAQQVLMATCDAFGAATPYRPWRALLEPLVDPTGSARGVADRLQQLVDERCPHLRPWLPLLASVLDVHVADTPEVLNLDERFRRQHVAAAVTELLDALLLTPAVLAVDDVHLADDASADLLRAVATDVSSRRWVLAVARRPTDTGFVPDAAHVVRVTLHPLDADDAQRLLEAATETDPLALHVLTDLRDRAGGNPLFLHELLNAHRRLGSSESLPETLEDIFASAIDSLPDEPRRLLRTAAVLGMRFSRALLDQVILASGTNPKDTSWSALGDFLVRTGDEVHFRNVLLRETAYEALPFRRRLELHGVAGDVIERSAARETNDAIAAMSQHFFSAQRYELAAHYSRLAGERARAQYANVEAAVFYRRALEAMRTLRAAGPAPREIARALGDVWYAIGDLPNAEAAYLEARRHAAGDPVASARLRLQVARVRRRAGNTPLALRCLTLGLRDLSGETSRDGLAAAGELCAVYAQVRQEQGRQRDAIRWAERAITLARRVGARDVLAHAYQYLDLAGISLGRDEHEPLVHEALAIWADLGDRNRQAALLNHLGIRAYYRGEWSVALSHYERARVLLEQIGDHWNAAIAAMNVVEIQIDQGRLADADVIARQCLRTFRAADTPATTAIVTGYLGRIAVREARYDDALALFTAARDGFTRSGDQGGVVDTDARMLEVLVRTGHAGEALLRCHETLARVRGSELRVVLPLLERVRGAALLELGHYTEAREALELSLEEARAMNLRPDVATVLDMLLDAAMRTGVPAPRHVAVERDALFDQLGIVGAPTASTIGVPQQSGAARPMPA